MNWFKSLLTVCVLSSILPGVVLTQAGDGKIPITTQSEKARDLYLQGRDLQEKLRGNEALPFFKQAIEEDADFALGYFGYAVTAPSAKAFFKYLNKAVSLSEKASVGERLLIQGFQAGVNGNPVKQGEMYKKLAAMFVNDERALNTLGGFYFGQQDWDSAIKEYNRAIAIAPDFSQPYNQLGYAYRFMGQFEDAATAFKQYIAVLPNDPNPLDSYAELLLKMGKYDESIENYKKALAINPAFLPSFTGIATCYNLKGEPMAARKNLDEMVERAGNDGQRRAALFARTISYIFEGNWQQALKEQEKMFELAKKINDTAAMSGDLVTMANILIEFGKPDEALNKYEASIKMVHDSQQSEQQKQLAGQFQHFNLFNVAESKGDVALAKNHLTPYKEKAEALGNVFQIRQVHEMLGRIALLEKKYETALAELLQANVQNPYNLYRLAVAYAGQGAQEKAEQWFEKAANFNALNNLNQAFVHQKMHKITSMK